jgi:glutaredoxin-like protein NrdH
MSVVVLSKPNCVQCSATERALTKSGIEFTKRDMTQDEEAYDLAVSLGYQAAPVVIAGEDHWGGFRPEKIASLVA